MNQVSRRSFLHQAGAAGLGVTGLGLLSCSDGDDDEAAAASPQQDNDETTSTTSDLEPSEYLWTGARLLFVTVPIKEVSEGQWLAPGLTLRQPATATFFVAQYPLTAFRSVYNEAAVFIHVEDAHGPARHCPWMVVDDDTALVYGRELLGFPKKLAKIDFDENDDSIVGSVTRHDKEVLRIEAKTSDLTEEEGPVWNADRTVNVHGSIVGGMKLLDYPPLPEEVHERSVGKVSISVDGTDRDPLAELEPEAEGDGLWAVADFAKLDMVPRLSEPLPGDWAYSMSIFSIRVQ